MAATKKSVVSAWGAKGFKNPATPSQTPGADRRPTTPGDNNSGKNAGPSSSPTPSGGGSGGPASSV